MNFLWKFRKLSGFYTLIEKAEFTCFYTLFPNLGIERIVSEHTDDSFTDNWRVDGVEKAQIAPPLLFAYGLEKDPAFSVLGFYMGRA